MYSHIIHDCALTRSCFAQPRTKRLRTHFKNKFAPCVELRWRVPYAKSKLLGIERKFINKYYKIYRDRLVNVYEKKIVDNKCGLIGNHDIVENSRYSWVANNVFVSIYDNFIKKRIANRRYKSKGVDTTKLIIKNELAEKGITI